LNDITIQRDGPQYQSLRNAALEEEIERARAGSIQSVGREAAAFYLKIHTRTLSRYNAQGIGPKSNSLSSGGGMGQSAKVFYRLEGLDEWREGLSSSSFKERKLKMEAGAKHKEVETLRLEIEVKELNAEVARLKRLLSKKSMGFAGIHDATADISWVLDEQGRVLGTVYDLTDTQVQSALRKAQVEHLTALEALELQWADINAFVQWAEAVHVALTSGTQDLDELRVSRVQRHELMSHVGCGDGEG